MDISRWPIQRIMTLPDNCFGRRWPIRLKAKGKTATNQFVISMHGLPDVCVVWYFQVFHTHGTIFESYCHLRLGDEIPATWAQFLELERLFPRPAVAAGLVDCIYTSWYTTSRFMSLRMPVQAQGRRIILGVEAGKANGVVFETTVVVSSIPREVPDCLLSG